MTAHFSGAGYEAVPFGVPADVTVIHGCAITSKAEHSSLYAARQAKRIRPDTLVILAGCPAETLGKALNGNPNIDLTIGQGGKYAIPEMLNQLDPKRYPIPQAPHPTPTVPQFDTKRALIKIQDGCDFHCAYCIVPTTRGNPISRPIPVIRDEVLRVTDSGFSEIVLTGANLGRYEDGSRRLADLILNLESIPAVKRIRLSSIEITTTENAIIDHMAASTKLCHFLHIPLQSGDDRILAAMGRRYDSITYRRTIETSLSRIPDLGLGTDIIVGFPGEDSAAFGNTVTLVRELPFSNLHIFPYSQRSGTRADTMDNQIATSEKKERLRILTALGETKRQIFAERFVGQLVSILIERIDADGTGHGWTSQYLEARVSGPSLLPRAIVTAQVTQAMDGCLDCNIPTNPSTRP